MIFTNFKLKSGIWSPIYILMDGVVSEMLFETKKMIDFLKVIIGINYLCGEVGHYFSSASFPFLNPKNGNSLIVLSRKHRYIF